MPHLTGNCPRLRVFVCAEFLHNDESHHGELYEADVVGVKSVPGRVLAFHVLLRDGAVFWDVPVHGLRHLPLSPTVDPDPVARERQWWDCPSYDFTTCVFDRLAGLSAHCSLRDGTQTGEYLWTIDWCHPDPQRIDTGFSEFPAEAKCGHLFALADGTLALLPNNKLRWLDPAFVVEPPRTSYLRNTHTWSAEAGAPTTPDSDREFEDDKGVEDGN